MIAVSTQKNIVRTNRIVLVVAAALSFYQLAANELLAADSPRQSTDKGMTIIGDQEAPTVLNVVPWKNMELSVDPWGDNEIPTTKTMGEEITPIDQQELMREFEYFDTLHNAESDMIDR